MRSIYGHPALSLKGNNVFVKLDGQHRETITIVFEDAPVVARKGLSLAAALLEAGVIHFRDTPVSKSARSPFCMMGACFDCLVSVDGMENRQACMIKVQEGMHVVRQKGAIGLPDMETYGASS